MSDTVNYGPETFQQDTNLSPEAMELLHRFDELFVEWTARLNLVAKSTIPDRWHRHYLDSAQMFPLLETSAKVIMDFGSGGGFPGLFMAILAKADPARPHQHFYLVESITKKCAFLREVKIQLKLDNLTILNERIEAVREPKKADIITARALADLSKLFAYAHPFLHKSAYCLFMKGERAQEEIETASKDWRMDVESYQSMTNKSASILEIRNLKRV